MRNWWKFVCKQAIVTSQWGMGENFVYKQSIVTSLWGSPWGIGENFVWKQSIVTSPWGIGVELRWSAKNEIWILYAKVIWGQSEIIRTSLTPEPNLLWLQHGFSSFLVFLFANLTRFLRILHTWQGFFCIFYKVCELRFTLITKVYTCVEVDSMTFKGSYLKCTTFVHKSLGPILDMPIFNTSRIHYLFIWSSKNALIENLELPFDFQQDPTII